jgi:WD40 repeat protein
MTLALSACAQGESVNFPIKVQRKVDLHLPDAVVAVAWSQDGSKLATASGYGRTLTVWDRGGKHGHTFDAGSGPNLLGSLDFAYRSSELAFNAPDSADANAALSIFNADNGSVTHSVVGLDDPRPGPRRVALFKISPDQKFLVTGKLSLPAYANIGVYSMPDWRLFSSHVVANGVSALNFFGADEIVVGGLGVVTIIDPRSSSPPRSFGTGFPVAGVAGSPDGTMIFAGARGAAPPGIAGYVLRASDGRTVATFKWPAELGLGEAEWDPLGRFIAFLDFEGHDLFLWRPLETKSYQRIVLPSRGYRFAIAPDGGLIAVALETGVAIYSVDLGA